MVYCVNANEVLRGLFFIIFSLHIEVLNEQVVFLINN